METQDKVLKAGPWGPADRTNQNIAKKDFLRAYELAPLSGTTVLQDLRGPSYLYAILMDDRIRQDDW